ncbi:MAG: VCBS repeat-containing protein [Pirellulaceae bacterium]|nr:VCBS repeat-containing protein [Pirellulaceae bacterium]
MKFIRRLIAWWLAAGLTAGALIAAWQFRRTADEDRTPPVPPVAVAARAIELRDVLDETGIDFVHTDGSSGRRYIVETVSAGLALFDYDGDGLTDIYFVNGASLPGGRATEDAPPRNALYRNEGGWRFCDVTDSAGVGDTGFGLGVTVADYNNDGFPDLFVNNFGPNVLYRNNGDGTFSDVTSETGTAGDGQVGAGACFLDIQGNGNLDLYVANYVKFTIETNVSQTQDGHPVYVGPRSYQFEPDLLYRNNGDGTFTDISAASGIASHAGSGMGMVCCDYDGDGDTDAFVLNDVSSNYLFENDGAGNFREVALMAGAAYNGFGDDLGSMGVDCGDYDNDGWPDFLMTSYQGELPVLYRNRGDGTFEDITVRARVGTAALRHVNWGVGLVDFDNDRHRDIFMACGHLQDNIHLLDGSTAYHARNILLANNQDGTFSDVSAISGDGMRIEASSRGAAFDDLDNDGRVDVVVLNSRREPSILRNRSSMGHHWIQILLCGIRSSRDAVGARVRVVTGDLVQTAEVHSGRGYQSHWGTRLHFGLGTNDRVDRLEVRWPAGHTEVFERLEADRLHHIIESEG